MPYVKLILLGILGLAVFSIIGLGYHHYVELEQSVVTLQSQKITLEGAIDTQKQTIASQSQALEQWQTSMAQYRELVASWAKVQEAASADRRHLDESLGKHDLGKLAGARPEAVERAVNAGTADSGLLLRCASGSQGPDCPSRSPATAAGGGAPAPVPGHPATSPVEGGHPK